MPSDRLLSIGVFARRSRLSMKALRLYDRRGLLTPADVDRILVIDDIERANWERLD
jgi:DNA-binding transcriptional MerR regulator